MAFSYMIPSVTSLPAGYDCTVEPPVHLLGACLDGGCGAVGQTLSVYSEGTLVDRVERRFEYADRKLKGDMPEPYLWSAGFEDGVSGYLENSFVTADGSDAFNTNQVLPFYAIYNKPGKKSFFSDNAYLYASPPVIAQIAKYGKYIDGYPSVRIDRKRNLGESIILINPYRKPLKATILAANGQKLPPVLVPPQSVRCAALDPLAPADAESWTGQIQITATNRVITFDIKHALSDPTMITDHEHLDPYRGEPTHFPATQWFRLWFGQKMKQRGMTKPRYPTI